MNNVLLPNFIAGKQVVPFLFQEKCNPEDISLIFSNYYSKNKFYKKKFRDFSKILFKKMKKNDVSKSESFAENSAVEVLSLIK